MDDGWHCGAHALAYAEAYLKPQPDPRSLDAYHLRLRYSDSSPTPLSRLEPLVESDVSWKCGPLASVSEFLPRLLSAMNREGQLMLIRKS